jgi:ABC-type lipoprotein export system ATPase subunit
MSRPTSGRIHLRDQEITSLPERFLTEIRRKTFGFVFQQHFLVNYLTVLENVMLPMDFCHLYNPANRRKRAREVLDGWVWLTTLINFQASFLVGSNSEWL